AITSHTGSLAQDENIIEAVFEKFGIIQTGSVEEFQDIISYLEGNKIPESDKIIVVTNAGGLGVLSADFVGAYKKLRLLDFPENIKKSLKKVLPSGASIENPVDILGDAPPERYRAVLGILAKKFRDCPLLVLLTPQNQTNPTGVAKILGLFRKKYGSISASFVGGTKIKQAIQELEKSGIPNFESPERALLAIQEATRQKTCQRNIFSVAGRKPLRLKLKANSVLEKAKAEKKELLFWKEAETVFGEYGVSLAKSRLARSPKEINFKKLKFPCVLKTDDPKIAHRWDKKAVTLNIKNGKDLQTAWGKMKKSTGAANFLVQPMAAPGLEVIIGMKRDQNFGPVIIVGGGGTFTEIMKDRVILIPPFSEKDVKESLANLKIFPILKGFRGEKGYEISEIAKIAVALQNIAIENPGISQIDINPAMLYNNGRKYQILDAKIYL
ncbi:MAG: acetate--CoA ligase family protein, partial [Candidatus Moranbacteria bacterium]|nr:acetate--CoA ligase family protein [Candidatus Moranbacteria bacterium]